MAFLPAIDKSNHNLVAKAMYEVRYIDLDDRWKVTGVSYYMIQHLVQKEVQLHTLIIWDAGEAETTIVGVFLG